MNVCGGGPPVGPAGDGAEQGNRGQADDDALVGAGDVMLQSDHAFIDEQEDEDTGTASEWPGHKDPDSRIRPSMAQGKRLRPRSFTHSGEAISLLESARR